MKSPSPDDKTLAAEAAAGGQRAFRELLKRYERPVFSLIYRMVRDRALAEDLSQEAFIRAFRAIDKYNPGYKFSSWIFKIAPQPHDRSPAQEAHRHDLPAGIARRAHRGGGRAPRTSPIVESPDERPDTYVENLELGQRDRSGDRQAAPPLPHGYAAAPRGGTFLQ